MFSGTTPTGGTLTYEDNILKSGCITFDEYKVTVSNGEMETVEKGSCTDSPSDVVVNIPEIERMDGTIGYFNPIYVKENPIYYNPVSGQPCGETEYQEANSTTAYNGVTPGEGQTQCLKWYAYSIDTTTNAVNMILDHNVTDNTAWVSDADYADTELASTLGITYTSSLVTDTSTSHDKGPLTVLNALYAKTDGWINTPNQPVTNNYTVDIDTAKYTIDYTGHKARLISADEIAKITNYTAWTGSEIYYFDSKSWTPPASLTNPSSYSWLFDNTYEYSSCIEYGCSTDYSTKDTNGKVVQGHLTSTPSKHETYYAYFVRAEGLVDYYGDSIESDYRGARPVITVQASTVF